MTPRAIFVVCRVWFLEGHLKAVPQEISAGALFLLKPFLDHMAVSWDQLCELHGGLLPQNSVGPVGLT